MTTATGPAGMHAQRAAEAREEERRASRASARISTARLLAMLTALAAGVWALQGTAPRGFGWIAVAALAGFAALVAAHDRVERRLRWENTVARWHEEAVYRLRRAWRDLPAPWGPAIDPHHPFAHDLDVFGPASVFQLLGPPGTQAGRDTLTRWLLEPATPGVIAARQAAARELAAAPAFRERLAAHGRLVGNVSSFDLGVFLDWAEGERWLHARPAVAGLVAALSVATPTLLLLQVAGAVQDGWWLLTLTVGLVVTWTTRHPLEAALGRASGWEPAIRAYVEWLRLVEDAHPSADALRELQARLGTRGERASRSIGRFQRIVAFAELRHSALLHFPVHALTLWDFHVWWALERWQERSGSHVRDWLEALGELEALGSLAALAHDHPDWAWPDVSSQAPAFEAVAIGHPLLPPETCRRNDVRVGPPGRVLCITGSNMSGKSTLLRAIGVNAVLAQAGAPVCAAALTVPTASVYTSLRVTDSLSEGVSFFMAALEGLRRLVVAADDASRADGEGARRVVLYLLDEILQGTNSVEREAAVRIVLRHLLATPAIGAITTHDLALTETPELRESGDHVHFRETIHDEDGRFAMTFDYRLRPGVATSRNALALLRLVGLDR